MWVDRPPLDVRARFLDGIGLYGLVKKDADSLKGSHRIVDERFVPNHQQVCAARVEPRKRAGRRRHPPFRKRADIKVRPATRRIYRRTPAVGAEDVDGVAVDVEQPTVRKGCRQLLQVLHVGWRLLDQAPAATGPCGAEHETAEYCGPHARVEEPAPPVASQVVRRSEGSSCDPGQPDGTEEPPPFQVVVEKELDPGLGVGPAKEKCAGKMCEHLRLDETLFLRRKRRVLLQGSVEDGRAAARLADDEDRVRMRHCSGQPPQIHLDHPIPRSASDTRRRADLAQPRGTHTRRAVPSTHISDTVPSEAGRATPRKQPSTPRVEPSDGARWGGSSPRPEGADAVSTRDRPWE